MSDLVPRLCLIGGGEKVPLLEQSIEQIDQPRALIIPSACTTIEGFERRVQNNEVLFGNLGVPVELLHDFGAVPTKTELDNKIGNANILYVIGGHTPTLNEYLRRTLMDKMLLSAAGEGKLLSGTSAGALLAFRTGQSNPDRSKEILASDGYEYIGMLGLIKALGIVHATRTSTDNDSPSRMVSAMHDSLAGEQIAVALPDNCALVTVDEQVQALSSDNISRVIVLRRDTEGKETTIHTITDPSQLAEEYSEIFG